MKGITKRVRERIAREYGRPHGENSGFLGSYLWLGDGYGPYWGHQLFLFH